MDITPYLGTIVTVVIAFGIFYGAVNARLARLEARIEDNQRLMQTEITNLRRDVEKHNQVVEKTAINTRDIKTAFNKLDDLKERDKVIEEKIERLRSIGGE